VKILIGPALNSNTATDHDYRLLFSSQSPCPRSIHSRGHGCLNSAYRE